MKKYYLPFIALGLFSGTLLSQNTFVTGNAKVKIQPGTLFYHGGNFTVKAAANNASVIENDGNIRIRGAFANEVSGGANFVSTYDELTDNYGQVIIASANPTVVNSALNRLTMQKMSIDPGTFSWGQFAIPYHFENAQAAFNALYPGVTFVGSGRRYVHSIMAWDNMGRPEYDQKGSAVVMSPTDYVILNLTSGALAGYMGNGDELMNYPGTPANGVHNVAYKPAIYEQENVAWNTWKVKRNSHGEQYVTYIEEHLRDDNSTHFGRYYFQFGNPYTSNIDLSRIGTDETNGDGVFVDNLLGVVKITGMQWAEGSGVEVANVGEIRATYTAGTDTWAGNPDALLVKPFEGFYIGLTDNVPNRAIERTFTFNDGLKTFSNVPFAERGGTITPKMFNGNSSDVTMGQERALIDSNLSHNYNPSRSSFYQLGLNLYTEDGMKTGNTVYVVVDSNSQNGIAQPLEADYTDFQMGFFLTQETSDGSEVEQPNRTMQINTVHPKYVSKPIPLYFKTSESDINAYYLKADLFYKSIFNKLKTEDINFVDGNSYFFYDKAQDILLPITTDFSYYIERAEEALSSRYVVYWNGGPITDQRKLDVTDELAGTTQVYKDGEVHKIRFNESWLTADIAVYDLAGRSIFKKAGVKTDIDFTLDLPNTSAYVVKIQSNNGEIVTQKIIR